MNKLNLLGATMAGMIAPLMARMSTSGQSRIKSLRKQDPIDANEQRIVAADKRARRGLRLTKENR